MQTETVGGINFGGLEETLGDLDGKQGYFVEPGTAAGTYKLLATVGKEVGVIVEKADLRDREVQIHLLGSGGIMRVRAGGVIAGGAQIIPAVGGKAATLVSGFSRGIKKSAGNSADGDLIEVYDIPNQKPNYSIVKSGVHTWAGGAATTDSIAVAGLENGDIILPTLVARASTETLVSAVNDHANDQIDLTLSANGTDGTTKVSYLVLRAAA